MKSILRRVLTSSLLLALCAAPIGCSGGGGGGDDDDDGGSDAPAILSLAPTSGLVGTSVTITGERFGDEQGASTVTFGGHAAAITSWSDTQIVSTVPAAAYPGDRSVVVTVADPSLPFPFAVVLPEAVYANNNEFQTSVTAFVASNGSFVGTALVVSTAGSSGYSGDSSAIFVHAGTRRVFSSHAGAIAVYDVDPLTGALTAAPGSPFATGQGRLFGVEVNEAGTAVYAANCDGDDAVVAMSIAPNGALAHLPGSPHVYAGFSGCVDVVRLTADEAFLVASVEDGTVRTYGVATADGRLTEVGGSPFTFPNNGGNYGYDMHPSRNVFYLPSQDTGALYAWSVTPVTGAPLLVDSAGIAQASLSSFAFSEDGNRLFTLPSGDTQLFVFNLDSAGAMSLVAGSPFTLAAAANPIEIDGSTLWAGGTDGLLYKYSLSGTGAPTPDGTPIPNPGSTGGSINALAVP